MCIYMYILQLLAMVHMLMGGSMLKHLMQHGKEMVTESAIACRTSLYSSLASFLGMFGEIIAWKMKTIHQT